MADKDFPSSVLLGRLYEKTAISGAKYLTGRLGLAKVAIVKAREPAEDGTIVWNLLVSEPQQKSDAQPSQHVQATSQAPLAGNGGMPKRDSDVSLGDIIPF